MKFKKALSAVLASVLTIGALCLPANAQTISASGIIRTYTASATVSPPTVSIPAGTYLSDEGFNVSLRGNTNNGEAIWYSTNGTGFRRYTGPIAVLQDTTLRAYTVSGGKQSSVAEFTYRLKARVTASLTSGSYNGAQRVFLNCPVSGAKIYYTLDGSTPTERSAQYSASTGILLKKSADLKATAIKTGWSRYIASYSYTITGTQNIPDDPLDNGGLIISGDTSAAASSSKLNDYKSKWGYNQLTSLQKSAYEKIFEAAKNNTQTVDISSLKIKLSDFKKAYWAFDYDNPQFLAVGSGYSYYYYPSTGYLSSFSIDYSRSAGSISAVTSVFNTTTQKAIYSAKVQMSDYAKIKYIHDWIINRTRYASSGGAYIREADGAVVYGKALCEGYSKTFMYLAQELGFDCVCVVGNANGGSHMWNMVKIGGSWYHIDVTFDDPVMSDGSDTLRYDYFLVSTYEISKTHTIDNPVSVPNAPRSY